MIEYVNFQNDVRFIADDEDGDCMDIDVKPGVEKVIFGDYYDFFLKLSKKVFPDVKELHISEHAGVISISNEMFPNVRKVTSEKNFYREGSMLCGGLHGDFSLYNTFCLKPDETADLSGISAILDFAFSGSETLNVTGSDGINTYNREAFNNSAIGRLPFVNGVKCINGMVFDIDAECDDVIFPDEDEDLHAIANHIPFWKVKQITVHRGSTVRLLCRCNMLLKTVNICGSFGESVCQTKEEMASRLTIDSIVELCDREGVENINIFDDSKTYKSIDGIVYSYDGKRLLKCPRGKTGHVTIPKGTEIIAANAFKHCHIDSVSFPSTLIQLENDAFASSTVKKIDFGIGIKAIGWFSFMNCRELKSIVIPHQMEVIEKYAFYESGVESVSFEGEEPIPGTAVLLPSDKDNLCCVDEGAFRRCDIEKVIVSDRVHLQQNSFGNIKELTTDKYDDSIIDTVFKNSVETVVKITIGDRMTVLPYAYAFAMHGDEALLHKACRGYFANGSAEMKSQIDSSFMLGNNDDVREIMAEKMYMMDNSNDAAKAFLQQHSLKIVKYVCDRNSSATKKERILTNYTRLDMLSDDTLHYVLEYANDNNMPILTAEVLDRINKNEAKNNNPEHTFRI